MGTRTHARAVALAVATLPLLLVTAPAGAAPPDFLLQIPEAASAPGGEAGEFDNPRAIAGDPDTGHTYITEAENSRVSEYSAWGLFVRAWGWDVAPEGAPGDTVSDEFEVCGPATPEATPPPGLCKGGTEGSGRGQFSRPNGIAVDPAGAVYVVDRANLRVQKFSSEGDFLLMFGGDVNKTKVEEGAPADQRNRCPITPADVCQAGVEGEGPSQLTGTVGDYIAYNPELNAIAVGDKDAIQIFNLDGTYREEIAFEGPLSAFDEETVVGLDIDPDGNFYLVLTGLPDAYRLSQTGTPLAPGKPGESSFEVAEPTAVAVDVEGTVYVIEDPFVGDARVFSFDATGTQLVPTEAEEESGSIFPYVPFLGPALPGIATNLCPGSDSPGNLYIAWFKASQVAKVDAYGTPPIGCEGPPLNPPVIEDQFATSAGVHEATVKARINPRFWSDTAYFVEYGTGRCSEGACDKTEPPPPGLDLTDKVVNATLTTASVQLGGLEPDTTYHYRFVAQSGGGGGPVFGIDPDGKEEAQEANPDEGLEATFRTFRAPKPPALCSNDSFRGGAGAQLPDCRAYELVSPLEKGNADVAMLKEERFIEVNQAAFSGDGFTFSSITSFGDPEGAPYVSQYLAWRDPDEGWSSEGISAPHTTTPLDANSGLNNEFKAFSADLCSAWLRHNSRSRLTPDAVLGNPNLYRRDNCSEPSGYEAITTVEPPNRAAEQYFELVPKGFSEDGTHAIFVADGELHPDAPTLAERELLLYEHTEGETRFVCYLPNGSPSPQACSAGTNGISGPDVSNLHNAISADGSRIFWTAYSGTTPSKFAHPGQIYVRIDGQETAAVSGSVTSDPAFFWTAAADGSKAIFEVVEGPLKGNLYEFDVATETATLIAQGVEGPMGASEDASRIYFASKDDLDEGGPAGAGDHNLYLYEAVEDEFIFLMELAEKDIGLLTTTVPGPPRPIHRLPAGRGATVSPDGGHVTFMSSASPAPTGYDNADAVSGESDAEVYRYDAAGAELLCVSCNPTGIRPTGMAISTFWVAARLQSWEMNFHAPRVLSSDGSRVFFESHEALVPRDTNGRWDVYQWEEPGKGTCSEDDATFHESNGGCIDLISSGESPADSKFLDADPSGDNVFIGTQASLIGADYGLNDVYVARVGGGFPESKPPVECEGEACLTPRPPPPEATPPSMTVKPGNEVAPKPKPRRCPKGKRRVRRGGKARCVPRKARKGRAGARRGAARR